ncbi:MAG: HlyD family secretion protein [Oryzomonas sp.]|uniref:HlyD family secretion protein n=1 Tax=Oryzomonas sp. TaxID=2855186 RepID=UPI002848AC2F|nr:HlyD family secretion protein [Oryzomonas sp.]MDR3581137.1 HlyD family secretion protein [Oryzomonas sp.]
MPLQWMVVLWRCYRKIGLLCAGVIVISIIAAWGYERLHHITENDARVRADMITVSSRVDGWAAERPVTDGQKIHRDEVLAVIDQREARLKLAELRAKAESTRLKRERTAIQLRMAETTARNAVISAQARHKSASLRLEQARREFQRADSLVERIVSRELWEQRQTELRQADAAERTASAALADAQAKLGDIDVLRKEYDGLGKDVAQIDAQILEREIDVTDRRVRSPIDGIVDQKFVQPGEYVIPGQRLFTIHDPKRVWIDADVKETKLSKLKSGQTVSISVDAYPQRHFSGHIERIGNAATAEFALLPSPNPSGNFTKITQRVPVRIAVEQPDDNPLRPGMMVEVDIDIARH